MFEFILIVAIIGTIVTLFPVVKRQNESIALGAVCGRLLEAAMIAVGMLSVLAIVTLRQDGAAAGADSGSLVAVGQSLVAVHDWTFLVGPSIFLGIYSLLLAYLMYQSQLVPRAIAWLGLVGGPLVTLSAVFVLFGVYEPTTHAASAIPVFAWEVSLGVYLIVKGFKVSPINPTGADPALGTSPPVPVGYDHRRTSHQEVRQLHRGRRRQLHRQPRAG